VIGSVGLAPDAGADAAYDIAHGPCDTCEGDVTSAEDGYCPACGRGDRCSADVRMLDDELATDDGARGGGE
jgi:hypothetical protein